MSKHSRRVFVVTLSFVMSLAGLARASDKYKIAGAEVVVVCPLTVGGSFEAKTKNVDGEIASGADQPGSIGGALRVDLQTLETGIEIRDHHMRDNYLEVQKGPDFAFATIEQLRVEKLDGKTTFKGILALHGQRKEISGTANLQPQNGKVRVDAQFPIKVSEFQIPKPTYLGVGVRDEIQVKVSLVAVPAASQIAGNQQ